MRWPGAVSGLPTPAPGLTEADMGRDCSCAGANETIVVGRGRRADVRLAHGLTAATIAPGKTVAVPSVLQLSTLGLRPANASTASPQNASTPKTFGVDSANGITVNIHDKEDHSPEKSPKHGAKCFPEHGLTKGTKMIASEAAVDFTVPNAGTTIPGGCIGVLYQILKREVMCFCPRTKETAHYSIEKREIFAVNPQSGKAAETDWHTTQTKYCESTPNADEACDLLTEDKCDVTLKSMTPKELANAAITMAYTDFGDYANSVGADGAQVANIDRRGRNFSLLDSKPTLKDSSGKEIKATYRSEEHTSEL